METSGKQTSLFGETELTSSRVGFRVSPSALPGSDEARRMTATSGRKCLEQLEKSGRAGLWGRMFAASLIGMTGWYSTMCFLTWKMKATKRRRLYFLLQVSTPRTEETGYGLLPTAQTQELMSGYRMIATPNQRDWKGESGLKDQEDLNRDVRRMWPTVTKSDHTGAGGTRAGGVNLRTAMMPTPTVNDATNSTCPPSQVNRHDSLVASALKTGQTGQLNPDFVREMMGCPKGWHDDLFWIHLDRLCQKKKSSASFRRRQQQHESKA